MQPARSWVAFSTIILAGCGGERGVALDCRALTDTNAITARCSGGDLVRGHYIGDLACFPFAAPERMRGVWVASLENSSFYRNAITVPAAGVLSDTWLEANPAPPAVDIAMRGDGPPKVYAVELIGRRSLCPGPFFGQMGMSHNEVVASRIISMRPLPLPAERPGPGKTR